MGVSTKQYLSEFARRYVSEGRAVGRTVGHAEALLLVLETRGLAATGLLRTRIIDCTSIEHIDVWRARATTAEDIDSVFEE